jgi:hypothetical protein
MRIFQIQISLRDIKPKIWRRILVSEDLLLSDFHKIIQTTMGWTNSHFHHFIKWEHDIKTAKPFLDWLNEDFEPDYFDLEEINEQLREENFGCFDLVF